MNEIVGARIGTIITTDPKKISFAIESNQVSEFIDRKRMRFMAACDLGHQWQHLAEAPTLFCIDDNGKPLPPNYAEIREVKE